MDIARIQPVGGDHAIEVMVIAIEWAAPLLEDAQIASLRATYEGSADLKAFLPELAPVQALVIQGVNQFDLPGLNGGDQLERQNFIPPHFIAQDAGFDLKHLASDGSVGWIVSIRPDFISVTCTAYDHWNNIKPQSLDILQPFLDAAVSVGAKINVIGLQYQDAFRLLDGACPDTTSALFRKDGKFLPLHLFEQPSFWHCHQGWFSSASDRRRILNNVATEVADLNGVHFARIGGQHRMFATSVNGLIPMPITSNEIDQALENLHNENLDVINGILSDGALKAIGCTAG